MKKTLKSIFIGVGFLSLLLTGCQSASNNREVVGYHVDENGHLIIEYNDGSTKDMGEYHDADGNHNYTVKFLNYDSSVLFTTSVARGGTAVYQGETPTRPKSDNYIYNFNGWSESLENVVGNMDVVAQYDMVDRYYTVTFNNYDGTLLTTQRVEYGASAYYYGTPTRPSSNTTNYTFNGWDVDLTNIKSNITATAQYTESTRYYTVTFKNWDGSNLGTEQVEYDGTVVYTKSEPYKAPDIQYASYTWTGWDQSLEHITENCTRTATFEHGPLQKYIVQFVDGDGFTILQESEVDYGSSITYTGTTTPTKKKTQQYSYTFDGTWTTAVGTLSFVDTNMVAKPNFTSSVNKYTVTFKDSEGNILDTDTVDYGSPASYSGVEPTKESEDENKYYSFKGWDISLSSITSDVVATAQFDLHIKFKKIVAGYAHYLAIGTDGYLYAWGSNGYGQLGDGTQTSSNSPKKIESLGNNVTDIFAGDYHSAAVTGNTRNGGKFYMWGNSDYGQCANSTYNTCVMVPTEVKPVTSSDVWYGEFGLGGNHTIAVSGPENNSARPIYGWGHGTNGQIGNNLTWKTTPTWLETPQRSNLAAYDVQCAGDNTAILIGTVLYTMGANDYGQIGNGNTTKVKQLTKITNPSGFSSYSLSSNYIGAIEENTNNLYMWGLNANGQFGNGTTSTCYVPTKIELDFGVDYVKCASGFTIVKSISNEYYVAGKNLNKSFGGNATSFSSFTRILENETGLLQIEASNSLVLTLDSNYRLSKLVNGELVRI